MTLENQKQNQSVAEILSDDVTFEEALAFIEFHLPFIEKKFPSKNSDEFEEELKKLTGIGWKRYRQIKGLSPKEKNAPMRDNSPLRQKALAWKKQHWPNIEPSVEKKTVFKISLSVPRLTFIGLAVGVIIACMAIYLLINFSKTTPKENKIETPGKIEDPIKTENSIESVDSKGRPIFPLEKVKIKLSDKGLLFNFGKPDKSLTDVKNLVCKTTADEQFCKNSPTIFNDYFEFTVKTVNGEITSFEIAGISIFEDVRKQYASIVDAIYKYRDFHPGISASEQQMSTSNLTIGWGTKKIPISLSDVKLDEESEEIYKSILADPEKRKMLESSRTKTIDVSYIRFTKK